MECDKVTHGRITMSHLCPSSQGDTWNFLDVQVIHCYNEGTITQYSNMQKIVFLQSLHTIIQKKIRFDPSEKVPTCGKQYSCNHCI